MEIDQHDISFRTAHSETKEHTRKETLEFVTPGRRGRVQRTNDGEGDPEVETQSRPRRSRPDRVEVSEEGRRASEADEGDESDETQKSDSSVKFELSLQQKMELKLIHSAFNQIAEGNFEFLDPEEFLDDLEEAKQEVEGGEDGSESPDDSQQSNRSDNGDFGFSYEYEETYYESEKLSFAAEGKVRTADGQEIDFNMDLNISREFFEQTSVSIQGGNARVKDPLVVNFDGSAAELSETNFRFDIDVDGTEEELAQLKPGSGFLALDENGNGEIDDGRELFGPETDKGFAELAEHDEDGNRFIDEGDAVFDDLMLMTANHSGEQTLISLEEAGVGAIFLGSADTEFSYKTQSDNTLQGQLDRTGVFIGEDGSVGSVQKINLAAGEPGEDADEGEESGVTGESTNDTASRIDSVNVDGWGREGVRTPRFTQENFPAVPDQMPLNPGLGQLGAAGLNGFSRVA